MATSVTVSKFSTPAAVYAAAAQEWIRRAGPESLARSAYVLADRPPFRGAVEAVQTWAEVLATFDALFQRSDPT
jgi:hypothetical protein